MAIFRKIHTSFWSDSFVSELDNDQKLFYIYLMTNERTKQCGVYEITKKQISFDLGYSIDKVSKLLTYFITNGKIRFNDKTNELAVGNWLKYNNSTSPKVQSCINQEFSKVKDTVLIEYVKSMDTHPQEEQEEEEEQKPEEDLSFVSLDFLDCYNVWMTYKGQRKEGYKSEASKRAFYDKLVKMSGNNPNIALQIINQSMANNWAGIFELKNVPKNPINKNINANFVSKTQGEKW